MVVNLLHLRILLVSFIFSFDVLFSISLTSGPIFYYLFLLLFCSYLRWKLRLLILDFFLL